MCGLCELGGPQHFITKDPNKEVGEENAVTHELVKKLHKGVPEDEVLKEWQTLVPEMNLKEMRKYLKFPETPMALPEGCAYSFHIINDDGTEEEIGIKHEVNNAWVYPDYDETLEVRLNDKLYGEP